MTHEADEKLRPDVIQAGALVRIADAVECIRNTVLGFGIGFLVVMVLKIFAR